VPVVIPIMIVVMVIVMIVTPSPIFLLPIMVQSAKVAILATIFDDPLMVVDIFVIVPAVIVVVIRVVDAIGSGCTPGSQDRRETSRGQQERTEVSVSTGQV
jgi:hypothetical protein